MDTTPPPHAQMCYIVITQLFGEFQRLLSGVLELAPLEDLRGIVLVERAQLDGQVLALYSHLNWANNA